MAWLCCLYFPFLADHDSCECYQSVEHQQLVAELISPEVLGELVDGIACHWTDNGDVGHCGSVECGVKSVEFLFPPVGEHGAGEESQQRAVGVGAENIYRINHAGAVERAEQ